MREGCGVKHVGCWPVNGRHLPSAFGEPDGIGAFSCADVESEARRQVGDLSRRVLGFPLHTAKQIGNARPKRLRP